MKRVVIQVLWHESVSEWSRDSGSASNFFGANFLLVVIEETCARISNAGDWLWTRLRGPSLTDKSILLMALRRQPIASITYGRYGAGDEIRTHDFNLGKVALYP